MNGKNNSYIFAPAVSGSGFEMDGYFVWCGSVVEEGGVYYLFAARWKEDTLFPVGYLANSEIVVATTDDLSQPFKYQKTVISKRDGGYWDSAMAHNPYIVKADDGYYLYYIGSHDGGTRTRKIGYAYAKELCGEWQRSDAPIELPPDANNPSVLKARDGRILLYFRDGTRESRVHVAVSDRYDGGFKVENADIFPEGPVEDMFVYETESGFEMIAEDCDGYYTGLKKGGFKAYSADGIHWDSSRIIPAYGFEVEYDDGRRVTLQRRERPFLLKSGGRKYLFTGAKINGETTLTGGHTWNLVQEILSERDKD